MNNLNYKKEENLITECELERLCMDSLDDSIGTIKFGSLEYSAGQALKKIDPIAFHQELAAYIDGMIDNQIVEIDDKYYWMNNN